MTEIQPNLFIGSAGDAGHVDSLRKHGITAILNVADDVNDRKYPGFIWRKVGLNDHHTETNPRRVNEAMGRLAWLLCSGETVLIHCFRGHNRAPYVVSRLLGEDMWRRVFEDIRELRPEAFIKPWMEKINA